MDVCMLTLLLGTTMDLLRKVLCTWPKLLAKLKIQSAESVTEQNIELYNVRLNFFFKHRKLGHHQIIVLSTRSLWSNIIKTLSHVYLCKLIKLSMVQAAHWPCLPSFLCSWSGSTSLFACCTTHRPYLCCSCITANRFLT